MKGRGLTRVALALAVAAIGLTVSGAGSATHKATPYKVACDSRRAAQRRRLVAGALDGMKYVQKALGSKVQTTYKENIAVGSQFDQTVASLVSQGYKMIFATSYGYISRRSRRSTRTCSSSRRPGRPVEERVGVLRCS